MNLRLANMNDLERIKEKFREIVIHMNKNNIKIWNDIYPCEFIVEDIKNRQLYILEKDNEFLSFFSLSNSNEGEKYVEWEDKNAKAIYIDRLGVNTKYIKKGIGSKTLDIAIEIARSKGAKYLRLFVVEVNKPAINLYVKKGFKLADGMYNEMINNDVVYCELAFEIMV